MGTILVTDASVLINLAATGAAAEILTGCGLEFQVCPDVLQEVKVLRDRETGEEHAIDLEPLFAAGALVRIAPETDEEYDLLVDYAALLGAGDGEAMCFALAESRGHAVGIDDERAIRRAKRRKPDFETLGTLDILLIWQTHACIPDERMGMIFRDIFRYARFRPAPANPRFAWWRKCWPE